MIENRDLSVLNDVALRAHEMTVHKLKIEMEKELMAITYESKRIGAENNRRTIKPWKPKG